MYPYFSYVLTVISNMFHYLLFLYIFKKSLHIFFQEWKSPTWIYVQQILFSEEYPAHCVHYLTVSSFGFLWEKILGSGMLKNLLTFIRSPRLTKQQRNVCLAPSKSCMPWCWLRCRLLQTETARAKLKAGTGMLQWFWLFSYMS